jgi:hypothetical protein
VFLQIWDAPVTSLNRRNFLLPIAVCPSISPTRVKPNWAIISAGKQSGVTFLSTKTLSTVIERIGSAGMNSLSARILSTSLVTVIVAVTRPIFLSFCLAIECFRCFLTKLLSTI